MKPQEKNKKKRRIYDRKMEAILTAKRSQYLTGERRRGGGGKEGGGRLRAMEETEKPRTHLGRLLKTSYII